VYHIPVRTTAPVVSAICATCVQVFPAESVTAPEETTVSAPFQANSSVNVFAALGVFVSVPSAQVPVETVSASALLS
jgi:hypothetical protein